MSKLVIVESPTKARTISGFLPEGFQVEASMGHVRDLPSSAAEVPAEVKGQPWTRLGVNVERDFEPLYVVPKTKRKTVTSLKKLAREADELYLATDEDREGESIGWHLMEVLRPPGPVRRMVFHEITKEAILEALRSTREVDLNLVRAQETRRILDRLVGYSVSPLLWRKVAPRLSAGRVQSVAVRLLVLRERERRVFRAASYWDVKARLNKRPDELAHRFEAQLFSASGKRLATGRDFDESTGTLASDRDLLLLDQAGAEAMAATLQQATWRVQEIEEKEAIRQPYPPFTTATLQMEANRKLGLGAQETMRVAQRLYESGFITYMRTDSVNLSDEAIKAARDRIRDLYGEDFLHPTPRRYRTRSKGAQEAHEAIRPAGEAMLPAEKLPLEGKERALYDLIWKRAMATQMAAARLRFTTATLAADGALFKASGRRVEFPGFFRAYVEGSDDPEAALEHQEEILPPLSVGEELDLRRLKVQAHETKPPARYTEATLVKALEAEGIGRPSTYATIIGTIQDRGYVNKQRRELVPTFTAFAVTNLLEAHFPELVDIGFTAGLEQKLDDIATGGDWLDFLRQFFLGEKGLEQQVKDKEASVDPRSIVALSMDEPACEVRIGQFGPFLLWDQDGTRTTASLPPDLGPADLDTRTVLRLMTQKVEGPERLTLHPETQQPIYLKVGPYGPYVQLGDEGDNGEKPKRMSLPKGMKAEEVTPEIALKLLSLPRTLGEYPQTGKVIKASIGRFGPYVVHERKYVTVKEPLNVLDITLEEAVALIERAPDKGGDGARKVLKDLGGHPEDGKPLRVLSGRYGPYVNHGRLNATLPNDLSPEDLSMEQALDLLAARKEKKTKRKGR